MTAPPLFSDSTATDAAADQPTGVTPSPISSPEIQSLYRKYRPQSFDNHDLVGQNHIVRTLRNAIALGRVAHAYLFCGPRGTGKTTTARLLAKAVNCLEPDPAQRPCNRCSSCLAIAAGAATDVIEIDAASNRGIDDIRDLRERVKYAPVQLHTKFYIIDEAHQITGAAANAFLKTLEEPPAHTRFVLATTDPEELLPTILSRCQRFDFRRIGLDAMVARLELVAQAEHVSIEPDALRLIARHATGSLRDALSLLDQLSVYRDQQLGDDSTITADSVRALLGVSRNDRIEQLVEALATRDAAAALAAVNAAAEAGDDPRQLNRQLVGYLRVLLHQRAGGSPDADDTAREFAERFELEELSALASRFSAVDYTLKHSSYGHLPLEIALVEGVLRGQRPQASNADTARSEPPRSTLSRSDNPQPTAPDHQSPVVPQQAGSSLRDRVRGVPAAPPSSMPPARANSDTSTSIVSETPAQPNPQASAASDRQATITVEYLADLWPRIRQDVKAVNRRIEALLSSMDPILINGERLTLAAAYPFHRDKLNTDDVRAVVEEAISSRLNTKITVWCVLRGDEPPVAIPTPDALIPSTSPTDADTRTADVADRKSSRVPGEDLATVDLDAHDRRLQAAKNIFDADEIDPSKL